MTYKPAGHTGLWCMYVPRRDTPSDVSIVCNRGVRRLRVALYGDCSKILLMVESLKKYVEQITELPTVPVVAQEILGIVDDKLASVDRLEKVIQNDPAICAKVLSVANSVFFRIKEQEPVRTLGSAIVRIGFNNVKNIAVGVSLLSVFDDGKRAEDFDYQRIFNHSVTVGFIAKLLYGSIKQNITEEIVVNGMLHDLGFMVLNRYFSGEYRKVLKKMGKEVSLLEAEKAVLGFNHTDIGAWLAEKWNLPRNISDTVLYHHSPSLSKRKSKGMAVIHLADYVATRNIMGPVRNDPGYPLDHSSLDMLGMSEDDLENMEAEIGKGSFSDDPFKTG
ncbi:MAG: HDOD domain-containing protein [Deferribacteres bacterium]|nr:HDOD domain-containing protein [Deferribacteres bacterium]